MSRKVVITGMGAITPFGCGVDKFWEGLKKGEAAIGPITKYDTTDCKVKIAAEVRDFDVTDYMDAKVAKRMEGFAQFAVAAATEDYDYNELFGLEESTAPSEPITINPQSASQSGGRKPL